MERIKRFCNAQTRHYLTQNVSSVEAKRYHLSRWLLPCSACGMHILGKLLFTFSRDGSQQAHDVLLLGAVIVGAVGAEGHASFCIIGTCCVSSYKNQITSGRLWVLSIWGTIDGLCRWAWHRLMIGNYYKSLLVWLPATCHRLQEMCGN